MKRLTEHEIEELRTSAGRMEGYGNVGALLTDVDTKIRSLHAVTCWIWDERDFSCTNTLAGCLLGDIALVNVGLSISLQSIVTIDVC